MRRSLAFSLIVLVVLSARAAAPQTRPAPTRATPSVEKLGPFVLGPAPAERLTVVANYRPATKPFEGEQTLTSWLIQDAAGAPLFRQVIESGQHPEQFDDVNVIDRAAVLVGRGRRFLLVEMGQEPSAPPGGSSYVVFGFDRAGRLKQLARLVTDGPGLMKEPGPNGEIPLNDGRYLDVAEWTSWFFMTYRYEYDEAREEWISRNRCAPARDVTLSGELLQERVNEHDNVIVLRRSFALDAPGERVAVTPTSKIQPLQVCFTPSTEPGRIPPRVLFLQIRLDGKEGWVHEDDFRRLGMQQAG